MLNFLEKHINLINIALSCVVFVLVFICLQPHFLVEANYYEHELLNVTTMVPSDLSMSETQDLHFIKAIKNKTYSSFKNTELNKLPNIVLMDNIVLQYGEICNVLFENTQWLTVEKDGKLYYICKMQKASIIEPERNNIIEENSSASHSKPTDVTPENSTNQDAVNNPPVEESKPKPEETIPTEPPIEEPVVPSEPDVTKPEEPIEETPKEPEYSITEADKTQYVTASSLNVRKGPGTDYSKIGSLTLNDKVHVIGIIDNGWVKVEYKDTTAFVSATYLSDKKVEATQSYGNNLADYPNAYGVLKISSIGVDVVLYDKSVYESSQSIVDKKNSAAYLWAADYYGMDLIADHQHQGFNVIANAVPGSTIAKIITHDGVKTYICTDKFKGKNITSDMVDTNGESIAGRNNGGICMYTCYPKHPDIIITFWQPC